MRRFTLRLSAALFTFTIGVFAATAWFSLTYTRPRFVSAKTVAPAPAPPTVEEALTFRGTFRACKPGWAQGYEASDGEKLSEWSYPYGSHANARSELNKRLRDALRVVERTPRLDRDGNLGERVIGIFPPNEQRSKEWVGILWTEGAALRGIYAPSIRHALEFEEGANRL